MNEQPPELLTVPTELERSDGFLELAALAGSGLMVWWLVLQGVPIWWIAPLTVPLALWVLTGEAAGDVRGIGDVAVGLRNLCGARRAHEWLFAWWHYFRLRTWPDWKRWLGVKRANSYRLGRTAIRTLAGYSPRRILAIQPWRGVAMRLRLRG